MAHVRGTCEATRSSVRPPLEVALADRSFVDRAFWILWGFDALIAAVFVFFFLWGIADGTVSSFNIVLWLGILAGLGTVIGGGLVLQRSGRTAGAIPLLLVPAIPGMLFVVFFVAVIALHPRWN